MEHILEILFFIGALYVIYWQSIQRQNYKSYDDYLSKKRVALSTDKYRKFLDQQVAEITSQKNIRTSKGQEPDPLLDSVLLKIKEEQRKLG